MILEAGIDSATPILPSAIHIPFVLQESPCTVWLYLTSQGCDGPTEIWDL